jgi:hypothetical protein
MTHALAPRNTTDSTIIKLALVALFVALAAKSRTNGVAGAKPKPKPKRWLQVR